ncbi:hypothetical protein [Streptomyces sp. NPDC047028]|uniref:hypothetical protein n=1 Tax=Streptomyces sp. NPDC047028 TaxID=3155793 RepID=UPI0033DAF59D
MSTGPQKYPGASTSSWWQSKWGGDLMEVNVLVLHTTEGIGLTDYDGGSMAPNLTAVADCKAQRLRWYQHFDIDRSSRALQNLSGGVETNTLNVVQVELEGTCDYAHRAKWGSKVAGRDYIYWGDPPDWALQDLADFVRWLHANHNVPLSGPSEWLTYGPDSRRPGVTPASYGASPARMTFNEWNGFHGICGHEHVPENDHGDPGSLPFAKLIALAKGAQPSEEDDMPSASDVWGADEIPASAPPYNNSDWDKNKKWTARYALGSAVLTGRKNGAKLDALAAQVGAQAATIDKLVDAIGSGGGLTAAEVKSAAEAGAQAALDRLGDALTKEA